MSKSLQDATSKSSMGPQLPAIAEDPDVAVPQESNSAGAAAIAVAQSVSKGDCLCLMFCSAAGCSHQKQQGAAAPSNCGRASGSDSAGNKQRRSNKSGCAGLGSRAQSSLGGPARPAGEKEAPRKAAASSWRGG